MRSRLKLAIDPGLVLTGPQFDTGNHNENDCIHPNLLDFQATSRKRPLGLCTTDCHVLPLSFPCALV